MRYRLRAIRIQHAERVITAPDADTAVAKYQGELDKPYGHVGSWTTVAGQIEVLGEEPSAPGPVAPAHPDAPLVLSVKEAAERLGVSRSVAYELIRTGALNHVRIGRRVVVSQESLRQFIEANTRSGY